MSTRPAPLATRSPLAAWWRAARPNTSTRMALVSLDDAEPYRAHWRIRLTQIIGGKRWSLSLVTYQTPTPELVTRPTATPDPDPGSQPDRTA